MRDNSGTRTPAPERPEDDPGQDFARDWLTVWQSELAAAAVDREAWETWTTLSALWANAAAFVFRPKGTAKGARDGGDHDATAGTDAAPRATAAAAAPDPRDAEIARLAERIEQLERRLEQRLARPDRRLDGDARPADGSQKPRRRRGVAGKPAT